MSAPASRSGYRYQDTCAMFFALDGLKNDTNFEHIRCEQDKMDFEVWRSARFSGYQVKSRSVGLTAEETNAVLLFCVQRLNFAKKQTNTCHFIFAEEPTNSLACLFSFLKGQTQKGNQHTPKFLKTALNGVPINILQIDFLLFEKKEIEEKVEEITAEIFQKRLKLKRKNKKFLYNVKSFVAVFRDEISNISCLPDSNKRVLPSEKIDELINDFLAKSGSYGQKTTTPTGAPKKQVKVRPTPAILRDYYEVRQIPPQEPSRGSRDGDVIDEPI